MESLDPERLHIARKSGSPNEFSFWDFLHDLRYGPEMALAYGKVFWPDLIEVDDYILLAENYDPDYLRRVLDADGPSLVEATINTTYLNVLFGDDDDVDLKVWEHLGTVMCRLWELRAMSSFPDKRFVTRFDWYVEDGDPGITLHQEKWHSRKQVPSPNGVANRRTRQ